MNKFAVFSFFLLTLTLTLRSQVVTTLPQFPTENDSVTVVFDASKGNAGLINYTGEIWAHTGVITNLSTGPTNWKYVIAGWTENTAKAKLKSLGNNLWELKITPSIRSFYNVPSAEKILKLAFVFRDATGTGTGRASDGSDIFADVFEAGLNISFVQPEKEFIAVEPNSSIPIQVASTGADSVALYLDGQRIYGNPGNNLTHTLFSGANGYHRVEARGYRSEAVEADHFSYLIKGAGMIAELPQGVHDGINYMDDHSVIFVLYAPGKEFVFLIGDHNDWSVNESFLLKNTPDGSRWWIQLDSLEPQKEYRFQYLVDGDIRIADPYSEQISDPWNDVYIDTATYPDLIAYPQGKTSQAVSVIQTARPAYEWKNQGFTSPKKENLVIYELLIRDFLSAHSFKALTDTLNYLKGLGINAIELMPVSEFEGNDSWGYNPSFYFAVDKYYGPRETFKAFIDSAHQKGIAVIMDMVLNHSYGQSPLVRLYWDSQNSRPAAENPWYNPVSPNTTYSWGFDFNHESLATQRFVDSVNAYWLKEYHIDGFRFDFTKGFTNTPGEGSAYDSRRIAILKRMADKIWQVNPSAFIILEHFAANTEEKELSNYGMLVWGNVNYSYRQAVSGWYSGGSWDFSGVSYKQRGWSQAGLVGYMESHDEERLMYDCLTYGNTQNTYYNVKSLPLALRRVELAANFFLPVPGPKMIWMFGELGYDYSINFNGRVGAKPVRWDYFADPGRKRLYQVYGALAKLKSEQAVFGSDDFQIAFQDTVKKIHLNHSTMNVVILGNFGIRSSWTDPVFQHDGWWYDYWTGDSVHTETVGGRLRLEPGEYKLYSDVKLKKPDILSSSGDPVGDFSIQPELLVYPNPSTDRIYLDIGSFSENDPRIRIFDLQGREMELPTKPFKTSNGLSSLDIAGLDSGIYVIQISTPKGSQVARFIKN